jgi:Mn-dependent DtxR family transcriptional regulator
MSEEAIRRIRNILGQPKKQWHNIPAPNITQVVEKLRTIVGIMLET